MHGPPPRVSPAARTRRSRSPSPVPCDHLPSPSLPSPFPFSEPSRLREPSRTIHSPHNPRPTNSNPQPVRRPGQFGIEIPSSTPPPATRQFSEALHPAPPPNPPPPLPTLTVRLSTSSRMRAYSLELSVARRKPILVVRAAWPCGARWQGACVCVGGCCRDAGASASMEGKGCVLEGTGRMQGRSPCGQQGQRCDEACVRGCGGPATGPHPHPTRLLAACLAPPLAPAAAILRLQQAQTGTPTHGQVASCWFGRDAPEPLLRHLSAACGGRQDAAGPAMQTHAPHVP